MKLVLSIYLAAITFAQSHENLNATVWAQTSVEHDALCLQAYNTARLMLDRALKDKRWTAALEQTAQYTKLPPAVILDLDETVFDNGPSQARDVLSGGEFNVPDWNRWVAEARAQALPGAAEFIRYAHSKGVAIFYISNREASNEDHTLRNLAALGLPADKDHVHNYREEPEWGADKSSRRLEVAKTHRILLLIGDDLGDFLPGARTTAAERESLSEPHRNYWGTRWIMLPNPMYGSWENALYQPGARPAHKEKVELKRRALDPARAAAAAP